jgi:hypothetical protein
MAWFWKRFRREARTTSSNGEAEPTDHSDTAAPENITQEQSLVGNWGAQLPPVVGASPVAVSYQVTSSGSPKGGIGVELDLVGNGGAKFVQTGSRTYKADTDSNGMVSASIQAVNTNGDELRATIRVGSASAIDTVVPKFETDPAK